MAIFSGSFGECSEYYQRATNVGASKPSISLQSSVQFPRCRVSVCSESNPPDIALLRSLMPFKIRYIVVDLMTGGDLRFHISRKTFTEDAVKFWMAELSCALKYIHSRDIVHRDVKPDNILLDSEGHVHLADFVGPSMELVIYRC